MTLQTLSSEILTHVFNITVYASSEILTHMPMGQITECRLVQPVSLPCRLGPWDARAESFLHCLGLG